MPHANTIGILPEIQAVVHNIALEALFVQRAVGHPAEERCFQTAAPDGQTVLNTGIQKAHVRAAPFAAFFRTLKGSTIRIARESTPSGILLER